MNTGGVPDLPGDFTPRNKRERDIVKATLLFEQDWKCAYCPAPLEWLTATVDHIVPKSWGADRGGIDAFCNLAAACQSCNSSKGARTPSMWREGAPA